MSLINPIRWSFWMGEMPMPEDCTEEQMWAMYDVVQRINWREYAAEQIKWYERLWRINKPKYDEAKARIDSGDYHSTNFETLVQTMKLIKQGIMFWREELSS